MIGELRFRVEVESEAEGAGLRDRCAEQLADAGVRVIAASFARDSTTFFVAAVDAAGEELLGGEVEATDAEQAREAFEGYVVADVRPAGP